MKSRPILFNAPMVRALLDGSKTQTRRVVKLRPNGYGRPVCMTLCGEKGYISPYGQVGDQLWVREGFSGPHYQHKTPPKDWLDTDPIWYWADGNPEAGDWTKPKPSIHMPRLASRITLEITNVRVERLQDITAADALAEGIIQAADGDYHLADTRHYSDHPVESYASLWESINGADSWAANPWVWVIEFKKVSL